MANRRHRVTEPPKLEFEQLDRHWRRLLEIAIRAVARRVCRAMQNVQRTDHHEQAADFSEAVPCVTSVHTRSETNEPDTNKSSV
jgi:hypothetical protein